MNKNNNNKSDDNQSALREIMSINVDNLREKQYQAFKAHVVGVLNKITRLIQNDDFNAVMEMTRHSAAGDGYGAENDYINFGFDSDRESMRKLDIAEACNILRTLKTEND